MNGSKTANLLTSAYNYKRQGKNVLLFKPEFDTRSDSIIKSRAIKDGQRAMGIPIDDDNFVSRIFKKQQSRKGRVDIIFIDEVQMLTAAQIDDISEIARCWSTKIHVYGLLVDYKGHIFDSSKRAIECGFKMEELSMTCDFCVNEATHHLLFNNGKVQTHGEVLVVGDSEYKSVCISCFKYGLDGNYDIK